MSLNLHPSRPARVESRRVAAAGRRHASRTSKKDALERPKSLPPSVTDRTSTVEPSRRGRWGPPLRATTAPLSPEILESRSRANHRMAMAAAGADADRRGAEGPRDSCRRSRSCPGKIARADPGVSLDAADLQEPEAIAPLGDGRRDQAPGIRARPVRDQSRDRSGGPVGLRLQAASIRAMRIRRAAHRGACTTMSNRTLPSEPVEIG